MGFTKSVRKGTITMDDYEGQNLEVVRQANTGLVMIRIDHLIYEQYYKFAPIHKMQCVLIEPELYGQSCPHTSYATADDNSASEDKGHGDVATGHKAGHLEKGKKFSAEARR